MTIITRAEAVAAGLKRYFTGIPCKNGHVSERLVAGWTCVSCRADTLKKYQKTAGYKAAVRKYQQSATFKASVSKYRGTEKYRAAIRRSNQSEKRRAARTAYRQTPKGKAATRRYNQSPQHRIALRINNRQKRARKRGAAGKFTAADERRLRERQTKCHLCGKTFTAADPATLDHVVALANGGPHDAANIALAHASCNKKKQTKRTHLI